MDAVSEVLVARADRGDGLSSMLGASAMAHIALVSVFVFVPAWWFGAEHKTPETIMQISLGGPIGPDKSGLTTVGGRQIQQAVPIEPKKAVEPVRPPSAKTPEMIEPTKAPPRTTTPNKVDAKDPRSNRPTKGAEVQKGSSIADTGARGQGFGLSSGGGGTGPQLEISNFCCPEYLATMSAIIKSNWDNRQNAVGITRMRFVIQKDGRITDIQILQSSGVQLLDFYADRALKLSRLPPLPTPFLEATLAVRLGFEYSR